MNKAMKIAFGCHLVAALLLLIFGLVYLFRPEFMPYHAEALARDWSAVERPYQVLILALMRATGGAWLATALAMMVLLFVPFRQGYKWARWTIPAVGLVVSGPAFYAAAYVRQHTPGHPPWIAMDSCCGWRTVIGCWASHFTASRQQQSDVLRNVLDIESTAAKPSTKHFQLRSLP